MNKPFQKTGLRSDVPRLGTHRAIKAIKAAQRAFCAEVSNG